MIRQDLDYSKLRLTIVIAHCNEDISWMRQYINELKVPIRDVTIYTKCNNTINGYTPPSSKIVNMPNVGRCDHTYANWMANMDENNFNDDDLILFIKGSRISHQKGLSYRNIHDVMRISLIHGFSCELQPSDKSIYYDTTLLKTFWLESHKGERIRSKYSDMSEFLDTLGIALPSPITPVCYGGNFVVKASQIYRKRDVWEKIAKSLMRGDNIEGKYVHA